MKNGLRFAILAALASGMSLAGTAAAFEPGEWLVKVGATNVDPKTNNHELVSVDSATSMSINFTYLMTDAWAIEVLAAYPFEHDISAMVVDPDDGSTSNVHVGSTKHLPPTVSLQWRPKPNGRFQPYFGLGFNYTDFFSEKTTGPLEGTKLSLDSSWGWAGQVGFDYLITDNVFFNLDLRYVDVESDATLDGTDIGTVKIDPTVYGAHLGFRF
jgi:outer membrane protein